MKRLIAVVGASALALTAGIAYATIPDSEGIIHGCRDNQGRLRVIDSANASCRRLETPLDWVQARAYDTFHVGDVEITGTSRATSNRVLTVHFSPGVYATTTEVIVRGTGDWVTKCSTLSLNDRRGPYEGVLWAAIGTAAGDSRLTTLSDVTAFDLPNGDDVNLICWKQGAGSGGNPVVEAADVVAVRVQSTVSTGD